MGWRAWGSMVVVVVAQTTAWSSSRATLFAGEHGVLPLVGEALAGWRAPTGEWRNVGSAVVDPKDERLLVGGKGSGVLLNGPTGRTVHLHSEVEHGDVEAHIEFMVPKGSNSGVYFQGRYEIQVFDSYGVEKPQHSDCGGIYQRYDEKAWRGYEGHPPRVNASRPPGVWQTFDVLFQAPRFDEKGKKTANARFVRVVHNGKLIHENVELTGPTRAAAHQDESPLGPLMLQGDHGPVAYGNITIKTKD